MVTTFLHYEGCSLVPEGPISRFSSLSVYTEFYHSKKKRELEFGREAEDTTTGKVGTQSIMRCEGNRGGLRYRCTTSSLSIHLSMGTLVASMSWLL